MPGAREGRPRQSRIFWVAEPVSSSGRRGLMKTGRRAMLARMFAVWLPLGTVALAPAPGFGQQFNISTLAGTGDEGFNGDG